MAAVQLTNKGAALIAANTSPISITSFKLGSASGYVPAGTDTDIHGSVVLSGSPSSPVAVSANVIKYSVFIDYGTVVTFGELGLYTSDGTLFALCAWTLPQLNVANSSTRIDVYLSVVGTNYAMWLDLAESNNQFQMAILGSVDQLPQPSNAVPNCYIITGASTGQSAFMAYTDRGGLWNFDAYDYASLSYVPITGFDSQSVTIDASNYSAEDMLPQYLGQVVAEFTTGKLYGTCRYVSKVITSGNSVTFTFDNPLMLEPVVGDTIGIFGRQAFSSQMRDIPIATASQLGGVKVGAGLQVTSDGTLSVDETASPVLSVNGKTGQVELTASDISGFATVATTGNYSDLKGLPTPYILPVATTAKLGGVKAPDDNNLVISSDGTIDINFTPVLTVNSAKPDGTGNVNVAPPPPPIGLVNPTSIANGTNLNSLQTAGLFFVADGNVSSLSNWPSSVGGTLDVEPMTTSGTNGDIVQRVTTANGIYFRRLSGTSWSSWVTIQPQTSVPVATTTSTGIVQIGNGLSITGAGLLATLLQTVAGQHPDSSGNITLTPDMIGAAAAGSVGGGPSLTSPPPGADPTTSNYLYNRVPFDELPMGALYDAGGWDASVNQIMQSNTSNNVPLLSPPAGLTATTDTTSGTLAAGTYYYVVTATGVTGATTASNEVSATLSAAGNIQLVWNPVTGATGYNVYRGTAAGKENLVWSAGTQTYTTTGFIDSGTAGTAGTPPTTNNASSLVLDTNTSLSNGGKQTIDLNYGGSVAGGSGNYQTVTGDGAVYAIIKSGTTTLDGNSLWNAGDMVASINGQWHNITTSGGNFAVNQINGSGAQTIPSSWAGSAVQIIGNTATTTIAISAIPAGKMLYMFHQGSASPVTLTLPSGSFFYTTTGGVSSKLTSFPMQAGDTAVILSRGAEYDVVAGNWSTRYAGIYPTTAGTSTAYTLTNSAPLQAGILQQGYIQRAIINVTNGASPTLNVDGLGAWKIVGLGGQTLQGSELVASSAASFMYTYNAAINGGASAWTMLQNAPGPLPIAPASQSYHAVQQSSLTALSTSTSTALSTVTVTASNALSTANVALSTANAAGGTANTALSTANTANSNATNANNNANSANSNASNALSTANAALSTANNAVVIGSNNVNTGSTGHISLPFGNQTFTLQWGVCTSGTTASTFNFSTPFNSSCLGVLLTPTLVGAANSGTAVTSMTKNGFTVQASTSGSNTFYYFAFGF